MMQFSARCISSLRQHESHVSARFFQVNSLLYPYADDATCCDLLEKLIGMKL